MEQQQYFIRPLKTKDAWRMLEWMHNDDIMQYFQFDGKSAKLEDVLQFIEASRDESKNLHRAIVDKNDCYLGTISLKNICIEKQDAEYAISLHPSAIGTGVAFSATDLIIKHAFDRLHLSLVYLNVLEKNIRAIRFYEKYGFLYEKTTTIDFHGIEHKLRWYYIMNLERGNKLDVEFCDRQ